MAGSAKPCTSDCTKQKQKQKQLLGIAKVKLPTLEAGTNLTNHFDHFEIIRSEEEKGPPLLAALFSNDFFRIPGLSSRAQPRTKLVQKPRVIPENPLAILFSEIKQELGMEGRKFWLMQSEYLRECIRRSRMPAIRPPIDETANTQVIQLKNNLSFLVRLFFEIIQGSEEIKIKGACDMPSLPDIYSYSSSTNEPKATSETVASLPADTSLAKQLASATVPISGFNTLFGINRK